MFKWHKKMCEKFMQITGMSWYGLAWVSFIKGVVYGLLAYWLYDLFFYSPIFM